MNILIDSILIGFGVYSVFFSFGMKKLETWNHYKANKFDILACFVFSIGGLLFLAHWMLNIYHAYSAINIEVEAYSFSNRMFGPYWYTYWAHLFLHFIVTQIFWIHRVRKWRTLRILIGLVMLVSIEKLIVLVTSIHRDFLPNHLDLSIRTTFINWLTYVGIFMLIVGVLYFLKKDKT